MLKFQGPKHVATWLREHHAGQKILAAAVSQEMTRTAPTHVIVEVDRKTLTIYGSRQLSAVVLRKPEMTTATQEVAWERLATDHLLPRQYVDLYWPHATRERPGRILTASNVPVTMQQIGLGLDARELAAVLGSDMSAADTVRAMLVTR